MTDAERPEDVYRPPAPPAIADDDERVDAGESQTVARVRRRSRVVVITVIAVSATLLIGAIATIVMLTSGLLGALGDRDEGPAPERPAAVDQESDAPPPVQPGECSALCGAMESEVGADAGAWTTEAGWSDAAPEAGATAAATAIFSSDAGTGTLTVLQFDTDEQAAQAVMDLRARIGEPVYQTTVFDDGSGTRYDYDGALTSRVVWHLDAQSRPHAPGRLYLIEAPAVDAADFSGQPAYMLYLALPF